MLISNSGIRCISWKYGEKKQLLENRQRCNLYENEGESHEKRTTQTSPYVQITSEGGYVVGVHLFHERSDVNTLIPFLDRIHGNLPKKFNSLIADSGYESEENYKYLNKERITPYIKPLNYEIRKTKKFKNDIGRRENRTYFA